MEFNDTITVFVGPNKSKFTIHEAIATERLKQLRAACGQNFEAEVEVPERHSFSEKLSKRLVM